MKGWSGLKDKEVKRLVGPIIEKLICRCIKGINEYISAAEIDMSMVTFPYQKLKTCKKLQLEGTICKWAEAQRVEEPQISSGSAVSAVASMSVS